MTQSLEIKVKLGIRIILSLLFSYLLSFADICLQTTLFSTLLNTCLAVKDGTTDFKFCYFLNIVIF